MRQHGTSLNDEFLVMLLVEVESIINSRPLTVKTINEMGNEASISISLLLTMKTDAVFPPPDIFSCPNLYSCRRWRKV